MTDVLTMIFEVNDTKSMLLQRIALMGNSPVETFLNWRQISCWNKGYL